MLVLGRRTNESILLGDDIVVTVLGVEGGVVKLGIEAPRSVKIVRREVVQQVAQENRQAASGSNPAHRLASLIRAANAAETPPKGEE